MRQLILATLVLTGLIGCATTTWHHPSISSPTEETRQFAIDEGYCLQVTHGTVPMPQVVHNKDGASTSRFQGSGSTHNFTGISSFSSFSGTSTTTSSAGDAFASGFANGMNMGSAIAAKKARNKVFRSCMLTKGWLDSSPHAPSVTHKPTHTGGWIVSPDRSLPPIVTKAVFSLADMQIYASPEESWHADIDEFLIVFPEYTKYSELYNELDREVKRVAGQVADSTDGSQILIAAHDTLRSQGALEKHFNEQSFIVQMYRGAVEGNANDQNSLSLALANGIQPFSRNTQRSFIWARKAALQEDPIGLQGAGTLLFYGSGGIQQDRINGYKLLKKSAQLGNRIAWEGLLSWEAEMSASELSKAKEGL